MTRPLPPHPYCPGAEPQGVSRICFAGSGTEAINLAIKGATSARRGKGNHIVTSAVEHPAVLNTCKAIRPLGYEVTYVKPDSTGRVAAGSVAEALRAHDSGVDHARQ